MDLEALRHMTLACLGLTAATDAAVEPDLAAGSPNRVRVRVQTQVGTLTLFAEPTVAGSSAWLRNGAIQLTYSPLDDGRSPWQVAATERVLRDVKRAFEHAAVPCGQLAAQLAEWGESAPSPPSNTQPWRRLVGLYHDSDLQPVEEDMFAAAWQLGLLAAVVHGERATAEALAAQLGLDPLSCATLLRCLSALELVSLRHEGQWEPTESGRELVLRRAAVVDFRMRTRDRWSRLTAFAQGRTPRQDLDAADWNALAEMWAVHSDQQESQIAAYVRKLNLASASRLLDVGSGSGLWATAMLHAFPQLHVTLVDYAPALRVASLRLEREGLLPRATLVATEFYAPTWQPPGEFDTVWFANTLHATSYDANASLLSRLHAAMPRAGRLLVAERVANPDSRDACRSEMAWMIYSAAGRGYTFAEMRQLVLGAGFTIEAEEAVAEGSSLIQARKG